MRKSRLKAHIIAKTRAENNCLDSSRDVLENNTLDNFIKAKDLLKDLGFLNNQCL